MSERKDWTAEEAQAAMQACVNVELQIDPSGGDPKHLRVGVNTAIVGVSALVQLLIDKGVIARAEWDAYFTDAMKREVVTHEKILSEKIGKPVMARPGCLDVSCETDEEAKELAQTISSEMIIIPPVLGKDGAN